MTHHVRPAHQVVVVRTYVHARNSLSKHICVAFIGSLPRARRVLLGGEGARSRERERERLACCSWRESLDYSNNPQQQSSSVSVSFVTTSPPPSHPRAIIPRDSGTARVDAPPFLDMAARLQFSISNTLHAPCTQENSISEQKR